MKIIENIGNHTSESIINVEIIAAAVIGGGALLNGGKTGPNNCAKWMLVSRIPRASAPPPFFFFFSKERMHVIDTGSHDIKHSGMNWHKTSKEFRPWGLTLWMLKG